MVKTFGEAADFTAFKVVDGDIYRVAWAKTMQVDKTEDGQEKVSSLCDYMLERYDYKPSMDLVFNDNYAWLLSWDDDYVTYSSKEDNPYVRVVCAL